MTVVVLAPAHVTVASRGADVRAYVTAGDLRLRLRELGGAKAVIYHEGFGATDQATIAATIREAGATCIEVRAARWDGFESSPLSAACQGVLAGFGTAAIAQAVSALAD